MTGPRWFSQPYPPEGASAAEGIRNQLGRPELDLLTILVRESAQNSWDARLHCLRVRSTTASTCGRWARPTHLHGESFCSTVHPPARMTFRCARPSGTARSGFWPSRTAVLAGSEDQLGRMMPSAPTAISSPSSATSVSRETPLWAVAPTASARASSTFCPSPEPSSCTLAAVPLREVTRHGSSAALSGRATLPTSPTETAATPVDTGGATRLETSSNPWSARKRRLPHSVWASRPSALRRPARPSSSSIRTWTNSSRPRLPTTWRRPSPGTSGQR